MLKNWVCWYSIIFPVLLLFPNQTTIEKIKFKFPQFKLPAFGITPNSIPRHYWNFDIALENEIDDFKFYDYIFKSALIFDTVSKIKIKHNSAEKEKEILKNEIT